MITHMCSRSVTLVIGALVLAYGFVGCRHTQSGQVRGDSSEQIRALAAPVVASAYDSVVGVSLDANVSPAVVDGRESVWLTYTLRNRSNSPVNLYVAASTFGIKVFSPSGEQLERQESGYIPLGTSAPPLELPPGGAFSRTLDLRCISWDGEPPVRTRQGACGFRYDFVEPGDYRVFVHYRSGGTAKGPVRPIALDADTVRFTYRPG